MSRFHTLKSTFQHRCLTHSVSSNFQFLCDLFFHFRFICFLFFLVAHDVEWANVIISIGSLVRTNNNSCFLDPINCFLCIYLVCIVYDDFDFIFWVQNHSHLFRFIFANNDDNNNDKGNREYSLRWREMVWYRRYSLASSALVRHTHKSLIFEFRFRFRLNFDWISIRCEISMFMFCNCVRLGAICSRFACRDNWIIAWVSVNQSSMFSVYFCWFAIVKNKTMTWIKKQCVIGSRIARWTRLDRHTRIAFSIIYLS